MNALWSYFWPCFAIGLAAGAVAGLLGFRRRSRRHAIFVAGAALAIGLTTLWHAPLGGASSFEAKVERAVHANLIYYEMTGVSAHLHHDPLTREVVLSGSANDFQRANLAALLEQIPGVESATWSTGSGALPLIVEGFAVAIVGFLLGLVLAYVAELRRRYNAQWKW